MKKFLAVLLAVLMMVSVFSGCIGSYVQNDDPAPDNSTTTPDNSTTTPDNSTTTPDNSTTTPDASGDPVKLEVWYAVSGVSGETFLAQSQAYDAANDNVTLDLSYSGGSGDTATKVSAAQLTNTAPDVALMYAGPLYTGGQDNFDMNALITGDNGFDFDDIYSGMMDYCDYMGAGYCALPYGISTQVMYYNKSILAAAGVDMSNPPTTWEEFYNVCLQVLEKGNVNGVDDFTAFDTSDEAWLFKSMLMQNGCELVENNDGAVSPIYNNAEALEVAEYWKSLVDSGIMASSEHDNAENKFLAGNLAFIAASSNRISRWAGSVEFEMGAIMMPCFDTPVLALGGNVLVILTRDPAKVQAAWEYLCYLTDVEQNTPFALATGYLPIHKSAMEQQEVKDAIAGNEMYTVAFEQLENTWAYFHFQQMGTMDIQLRTMLNKLEKGRGEPQELLDKAAADLQEEIDLG